MFKNASHGPPAGSALLRPDRPRPLMRRLGDAACRAADALLLWQERHRQRRALITLSDALLKDIGVTRYDASAESRKCPWQS